MEGLIFLEDTYYFSSDKRIKDMETKIGGDSYGREFQKFFYNKETEYIKAEKKGELEEAIESNESTVELLNEAIKDCKADYDKVVDEVIDYGNELLDKQRNLN